MILRRLDGWAQADHRVAGDEFAEGLGAPALGVRGALREDQVAAVGLLGALAISPLPHLLH